VNEIKLKLKETLRKVASGVQATGRTLDIRSLEKLEDLINHLTSKDNPGLLTEQQAVVQVTNLAKQLVEESQAAKV
jgi:hypothetical protein